MVSFETGSRKRRKKNKYKRINYKTPRKGRRTKRSLRYLKLTQLILKRIEGENSAE